MDLPDISKLSPWQILGGVVVGTAAGVGVVVGLPVFGPIGMVTALGAAISGGMGALVGGSVAGATGAKPQTGKASSKEKAEESLGRAVRQNEELVARMAAAAARFESFKKFEEYTIAVTAIAISIVSPGGKINQNAYHDISEFIHGIMKSHLPDSLKNAIAALEVNPPSFKTAMAFLEKVDPDHSDAEISEIIDTLIAILSNSANGLNDAAEAWHRAWINYRAA